jgi:hypothetical protein
MKKSTAVYIVVRVDIEHDENLSLEEVEDVIAEADYNFTHKSEEAEIIDTEICGTTESYI